jgi:hypothetical protein
MLYSHMFMLFRDKSRRLRCLVLSQMLREGLRPKLVAFPAQASGVQWLVGMLTVGCKFGPTPHHVAADAHVLAVVRSVGMRACGDVGPRDAL